MFEIFPATSICKLQDKYIVLVSGESPSMSFVYTYHVLALDASAEAIGKSIRKGLAGDRHLGAAEAKKFLKQMAKDELFADFDEWGESFPMVAIIGGTKEYELRFFRPAHNRCVTSAIPAKATDKVLGKAIVQLLNSVGARVQPRNKREDFAALPMSLVSCLLVLQQGETAPNLKRFAELLRTALGARVASTTPGRLVAQLPDESIEQVQRIDRQLRKISRHERVDLIWIAAVRRTDAFAYIHYAADKVERKLVLGVPEQFEWSLVEGVAEGWEAKAFKGEKFELAEGRKDSIGTDGRGPILGAISPGADSMHFANCALRHWKLSSKQLNVQV